MVRWTVPVAGALLGVAGSAAAMQGTPTTPPINVDTAQAVNACVPASERPRPLAEISMARRRQIVACIFADTARQINPQLPVQVDEMTRLDRITVAGPTLTYHYSVSRRRSELPPNMQPFIENSTRNSVCAQANMRQTIAMGGVYGYRWTDPDGRPIHQLTIASC